MAKLFHSLAFLLLIIHGSLARQQCQGQQNQCQFQRINALVPSERVSAEAGFSEFFDSNEQQFQCAGVEVVHHQIQPQGLLLPSYTNTPILFFVVQGNGIQGVMLPGCPETYEVSQQQFEGNQGGSVFEDRHQKIEHFWQGDMVAIPTGAAHWIYNNGQEDLVIVALLDSTNNENQLDQNHRRFFLAGNSQQGQQMQQWQPRTWGQRPQIQSQEQGSNNIFQGFGVDILAEAFNVDQEMAEMLRGEQDQRGHIVMVERGLQFVQPLRSDQEQQQYPGRGVENGLEETICSMKLRQQIDDASSADLYNPNAGWVTHLNNFKFPVLKLLQLSAKRGVLYNHGIVSPHWMMNAHKIIYVTNGNMRMQIVNDLGQEVFNDQIWEGQLIVVPQNFAVVKQADYQGCAWISFLTNENAMMHSLAGRTSAMRALPVDVLTYAYQISREEASRLKYSRDEYHLLSPITGM